MKENTTCYKKFKCISKTEQNFKISGSAETNMCLIKFKTTVSPKVARRHNITSYVTGVRCFNDRLQ